MPWPGLTLTLLSQLPLVTPVPGAPRQLALSTATVLSDGRVLSTGGEDPGFVASASTSLFDPLTGAFTPGPALPAPREVHSALRLSSGEVLLAGALTTAVRSSPDGGWTATAPLSNDRLDGQLLRFADGVVRYIGGRVGRASPGSTVADIDVYDPGTNGWAPGAPLPFPNDESCALALEDGGAVLFGGSDGGTQSDRWLRWNGSAFVPAGTLLGPRGDLECIRWPDETVTLVGGNRGAALAAATEEVNLATGISTAGQPMPQPGFDFAVALLPSARVVSLGNLVLQVLTHGGGWTSMAVADDFVQGNAVVLPTGRLLVTGGASLDTVMVDERVDRLRAAAPLPLTLESNATVTLPDGRVLVTGGKHQSGLTSAAFVYDPDRDVWLDGGTMLEARWRHHLTLLFDGRVLVSGGEDFANAAVGSIELYDPATGTFTAGPALQQKRSQFAAFTLGDGRVIFLGGWDNGARDGVEFYDPATNTTTLSPSSLPTARHAFRAVKLRDGRILYGGGRTFGGTIDTTELYELDGGFTSLGALSGVGRVGFALTLLPGGREVLLAGGDDGTTPLKEVWRFDVASTTWRRLPDLPTTTGTEGVVLRSGLVLMPLGDHSSSVVTYDPIGQRWASTAVLYVQTALGISRLRDGEVLLAGGYDTTTGMPLTQVERYGEEPTIGLPRPVARPSTNTAAPGDTVAFTGSALLSPARLAGASTQQTSWDEVVFALDELGGDDTRLLDSHASSAQAATATLPLDVSTGWYWVRPIVHGVSGRGEPLFVGFPSGHMCTFDAQCATRHCERGQCATPLDAGVGDAGESDAGATDGGRGPITLAVGCGCGAGPAAWLPLSLLAFARRRRR